MDQEAAAAGTPRIPRIYWPPLMIGVAGFFIAACTTVLILSFQESSRHDSTLVEIRSLGRELVSALLNQADPLQATDMFFSGSDYVSDEEFAAALALRQQNRLTGQIPTIAFATEGKEREWRTSLSTVDNSWLAADRPVPEALVPILEQAEKHPHELFIATLHTTNEGSGLVYLQTTRTRKQTGVLLLWLSSKDISTLVSRTNNSAIPVQLALGHAPRQIILGNEVTNPGAMHSDLRLVNLPMRMKWSFPAYQFRPEQLSDWFPWVIGLMGGLISLLGGWLVHILYRRNEQISAQVTERTAELSKAMHSLSESQTSLARSEKMAALGSLVAGVAHEMSTPIGNALTTSTGLAESTQKILQEMHNGQIRRSSLEEYLALSQDSVPLITRCLQRSIDILHRLKQVAADRASSRRRQFNLSHEVSQIVETLSPQLKKLPFNCIIDIDPSIECDSYPGPLGQVITNLIDNAIIHGLSGKNEGWVKIKGSRSTPQGFFTLQVSDSGSGIPEEHLERVFDPFFTTRLGQGGSGLGLNIAYELTTGVLGGTLSVKSPPGYGACFVLELPCSAPEEQ